LISKAWQSLEEIPAVKAAQVKSPEERAILFFSRLLPPNATKPRTEGITAVIDALKRPAPLSVADGKVVYANAG
jgi:hypothetical protein